MNSKMSIALFFAASVCLFNGINAQTGSAVAAPERVNVAVYTDAQCSVPYGAEQRNVHVGRCLRQSASATQFKHYVATFTDLEASSISLSFFSSFPCAAEQQIASPVTILPNICQRLRVGAQYYYFQATW